MNWFRSEYATRLANDRHSSLQKRMASFLWSGPDPFADHEAMLDALKSHWSQAFSIIQQNPTPISQEQALFVLKHTDRMIALLIAELNGLGDDNAIEPIMDYFFTENVLEKLILWMTLVWDEDDNLFLRCFCLKNLLKLFDPILSLPGQCLLVHKPVLTPLLLLLKDCSKTSKMCDDHELEKLFVLLLNQICVKIAENVETTPLFDFFFCIRTSEEAEHGPSEASFSVFSYLIPYLYEANTVGQVARDAALLILTASRQMDAVGKFVVESSNFCPVLATGLSALFSSLPRELYLECQDWFRVTEKDIEESKDLKCFYNAIEFCNAVVQIGHTLVVDQLIAYLYNGFLISVMEPAMLCSSENEVIAAFAYLELLFRTVTEVPLLKALFRFLIVERPNDMPILEHVISKISDSSRVSAVALALIETLLKLYCEDFLLELTLKYLIPETHLLMNQKKSQRWNSADNWHFAKSTEKFLACIPRCCAAVSTTNVSSLNPAVDDHVGGAIEYSPFETTYLRYLFEARQRSQLAFEACRCWSVPYDGLDPNPMMFRHCQASNSSCSSSSNDETAIIDCMNGAFSREAHYRKSKTNRYYNTRKLSKNGSNFSQKSCLNNLTLGESDCTSKIDQILEHEGIDLSCNKNRPSDDITHEESTPRSARNSLGDEVYNKIIMPTDYLKLSYDDDSSPPSGNGVEQSSKNAAGGDRFFSDGESDTRWMLRGWSQINDLDTFAELLRRGVRASQTAQQQSFDQLTAYVLNAYDVLTRGDKNDKSALGNAHMMSPGTVPTSGELVASKDSGFNQSDAGDDEAIAVSLCDEFLIGPLDLRRSSFSTPDIGPFLSIVLHKLENMLQNDVYTNMRLTGVITLLASHPQPLLNSFLLNCELVFQPSVRSIYQVLSALRQKIDNYAYSITNFAAVYHKARQFLFDRDRSYFEPEFDQETKTDPKGYTGKKNRLVQLFFKRPLAAARQNQSETAVFDRANRFHSRSMKSKEEHNLASDKELGMAINCVIFEEFCHELAACALEQSLRLT